MLFDDSTTLTPAGDGRFDWAVTADWDQGLGAYGGSSPAVPLGRLS
jgi:hypothetical protein